MNRFVILAVSPHITFPSSSSYTGTGARPNANWAGSYHSKTGEKPYRHKCTVCGRTDMDYPNLEFRYCSKCNGYYCYCIDHINNHFHITTPPEGKQ